MLSAATTLDHYVNDEKTIYEHALYLFDRNYSGEPVRHLGIHLGSLKDRRHMIHQLSMFEEQQAPNTIDEVLEQLTRVCPARISSVPQKLQTSRNKADLAYDTSGIVFSLRI